MKKILVVNYKLKPKIRIILNSLEDTKKVLLQKYRNIAWKQPAILEKRIKELDDPRMIDRYQHYLKHIK